MTKRRKLYQEKCRAKQLRIHRATDYVMRGLDPYIASKHFAIFDEGIKKNLAMLHIPKEKSWIEKAKERFFGKLNSDVEKQYIEDNK